MTNNIIFEESHPFNININDSCPEAYMFFIHTLWDFDIEQLMNFQKNLFIVLSLIWLWTVDQLQRVVDDIRKDIKWVEESDDLMGRTVLQINGAFRLSYFSCSHTWTIHLPQLFMLQLMTFVPRYSLACEVKVFPLDYKPPFLPKLKIKAIESIRVIQRAFIILQHMAGFDQKRWN